MGNTRRGKVRGGGRGSGHGRGRGKGKGEVAHEEIDDGAADGLTDGVEEDSAPCRDRRTTGRPQAGSIGEVAVTRPGRQTLPPPLNTRAANKNTHPGAIVAPATRRSSEVVQAERHRLEELRTAAEAHQSAAISRVAELEDQMALQDKEKTTYAHRPRISPDLPPRATHRRPQASTEPSEDCEYDDEGLYCMLTSCTHHLTFFLDAPLAPNTDLGMDGEIPESSESGSEYEGDRDVDECESEEEMEIVGARVAVSQARGKKVVKRGRDSVMDERSVGVVGKRKSQTDIHNK